MTLSILVTGASSGIGKATVAYFLAGGWRVIATMRHPEQSTLQAHSNLSILPLDVTRPEQVKTCLAEVIAQAGQLNVVVNNAGYGLIGPLEASTPEAVQDQFDTNVFGLVHMCRESIPIFRKQGHGIIINVASIGGRTTFPLYSLYHGSKWAVEGISESLAFELKAFGIRVKIIEPGPIRTEFYHRSQKIMQKPSLTVYDAFISKVLPVLQGYGAKAPGPDVVAETIWRAATDNSNKLRYPVNTENILWLRRLLPEAVFLTILGKMMKAL